MEREQALQLLKEGRRGIAEWNRSQFAGEETPDLSGADLRRVDLVGVVFSWANLSEADLSEAILAEAKLRKANLRGSNLRGAVLSRADLSESILAGANLSRAKLRAANLSEANLNGANLIKADLVGADLRRAELIEAKLNWADLKGALAGWTTIACDLGETIHLNEMLHDGPSHVSHRTLRSFKDSIPERFLRGCGLTNFEIDHTRSLLGGAIQFYSAFISYTEADDEFARRLHADLQTNDIPTWFAPEDLKGGDFVLRDVNEAIRLHDKLIVIFSRNSVGKPWLEHEVNKALEKEEKQDTTVLLPVMVDDAATGLTLPWVRAITDLTQPTGRLIRDFTNWKDHDSYQRAFKLLLTDLGGGRPLSREI